jgi:nucleoside-diphosphate-sugar epimerase
VKLRVAVTGSSGFIGRHVVATLVAHGHTAVRVPRPFEQRRLSDAFRGVDAIVHLAGVVSAISDAAFVEGNVRTTRLVAAAAAEAGRRLVHISSLAAAGPAPPSAPRAESDPPNPITTYGRTKLAGEMEVQQMPQLRWTILRPGVVYGPGDRALLPLFRLARHGVVPLVGNPAAAYTFVYIQDAVRAILAAVERDLHGETIFVGHPVPVSPRALVESITDVLRTHALVIRVPRLVVRAAAITGDLTGRLTGRPATITSRRYVELYSSGFVCLVDRMTERLGVTAQVGLREGHAQAAQWYAEQGLL